MMMDFSVRQGSAEISPTHKDSLVCSLKRASCGSMQSLLEMAKALICDVTLWQAELCPIQSAAAGLPLRCIHCHKREELKSALVPALAHFIHSSLSEITHSLPRTLPRHILLLSLQQIQIALLSSKNRLVCCFMLQLILRRIKFQLGNFSRRQDVFVFCDCFLQGVKCQEVSQEVEKNGEKCRDEQRQVGVSLGVGIVSS